MCFKECTGIREIHFRLKIIINCRDAMKDKMFMLYQSQKAFDKVRHDQFWPYYDHITESYNYYYKKSLSA